jgi:methionyl-tRNA synthetase
MSEAARFYLTTPIYYVNDQPHIGHVFTTTIADAIARARRLAGNDVFLLTGTDEHAAKVVDSAAERGLTARQWSDRNAAAFRDAFAEFGLETSDFIRTSEERHERFVREAIAALVASGDVYLGDYEGWYDASQEEYVPEGRAEEFEFKSPITGKPLVRKKEQNYFFRLSHYQARLERLLDEQPDFVRPAARRNEVLGRLAEGLQDVPISRTGAGDWGVRFPGAEDHLIYVWIDALLSYATAVDTPERRSYWPADVHLIGKDILWFHAVIWPAMLLALRATPAFAWLAPPRGVYAHSFWMRDGQKMSKSLGNFIDLAALRAVVARFGLDALRWYLITQGPLSTVDSDFSEARFIEVYNAELANTLGNAWNRVANMSARYLGGRYARVAPSGELRERALSILAREDEDGPLGLGRAARGLELVRAIDAYIDGTAPFRLAKDPANAERVADILYECAETYRLASLLLWPALPRKMEEVWRRLGLGEYAEALAKGGRGRYAEWCRWGGLRAGATIAAGDALFPRHQAEEAAAGARKPR